MRVRADVSSSGSVDCRPLRSTAIGAAQGLGIVRDRPATIRSAISASLVEEARAKFEQRSGRQHTEHEVREMLGTLSDFVSILIEWDQNPVSGPRVAQYMDAVDDDVT
jgi:hypothetical protein